MSVRISIWLLRGALAGIATLHLAVASASPEEDFRAGARSYAEGDVVTAMASLKSAADAGHAPAQALYAQILDRADSDDEAAAYYRKAAEQGDAEGQFGYGSMLVSGEGVTRNVDDGRRWIIHAAEQGHKLAINELALAFLKGQMGISEDARDGAEALGWIRRAADNDFVPAMEALGEAYRKGTFGLDIDTRLADDWAARVRKARGLLGKRKGGKK